ncbi:hypothetical protein BDFB_013936 [Asbolus verrucosus]|uniref:Uncharacterized protein n=1 Tax=Asbolus verrucosus TaxID=1661398 RepID=A0A482VQV3_ASBVE|nr:hypothetical protein BDFB_013936 [Asbolus verrucosus]
MASAIKLYFIIFINVSVIVIVVHIPFLGLGPYCDGCPPHFCDDDPAIVHGYCCGCARFFDVLPVRCAATLRCPPNTYDLCEDYEYMMHCCCN